MEKLEKIKKSRKYNKEVFFKDPRSLEVKNAGGEPLTFDIGNTPGEYQVQIKRKIFGVSKHQFQILIKGINDSENDWIDFRKFVIVGEDGKLLKGQELNIENTRRKINFLIKNIYKELDEYKRLGDIELEEDEPYDIVKDLEQTVINANKFAKELYDIYVELSDEYTRTCPGQVLKIHKLLKRMAYGQNIDQFFGSSKINIRATE